MDYSVLAKCKMFKGLSEEEVKDLLSDVHGEVKEYRKDEVVFYLSDFAGQLGIVLSGAILVSKIFESGQLVEMTTKRAGDLIGEVACFSGAQIYPCELTAEKSASIFILQKEEMIKILQKDSRVLQNFLGELCSQSFFLHRKIELLSYKGTDQKLAYFLLQQSKLKKTDMVPLPGSIVKLALLMNVSRTTLHREIRNLEDQGLIEYGSKKFKILDREGLEEILSED